eukprot:1705450-Amphidinium_carterae.2
MSECHVGGKKGSFYELVIMCVVLRRSMCHIYPLANQCREILSQDSTQDSIMSNDSWKPRLASYGRGSSSSSGSRNNYTSWNSTGWHEGGKGSGSSGSHMSWQPDDWNAMGYGSSSSGNYMPYGNVGWNVGLYATTPTVSTMSWGTAGRHTGEQVAWRPEGGTSGSRVGVPPTSEPGTSPKKPNKKINSDAALRNLEAAMSIPESKAEKPTRVTKEPNSGNLEDMFEDFDEDLIEEETGQTYYPDPRGMRSKPYPVTQERPHPHLEKDKVVYKSEKGRGTYPFSCVPRFSDVIKYEGFPVTPTPPWVDPKGKPVHKPEVWRKAYASKLIRQHEERRAFFERTSLPNAEAYPHPPECENMKDLSDMTPFDIKKRCSLAKWVMGANSLLQEYCYQEIKAPEEGLHYWCYICGKAPSRDVSLARCAACSNVFMCMEHRIFPDCVYRLPGNKQITMCCRHSRYTQRPGSWNPRGGYPQLADVFEVKVQEEWRKEGWFLTQRELQLQGLMQYPLTKEQMPMVESLLDQPLTDEQADLVVALVISHFAPVEETGLQAHVSGSRAQRTMTSLGSWRYKRSSCCGLLGSSPPRPGGSGRDE